MSQPKQQQEPPSTGRRMEPTPNHGEESYRGSGWMARPLSSLGRTAASTRSGPAAKESSQLASQFSSGQEQVAPRANPQDTQWIPGDAQNQALRWATESVAKAGTIGIRPGFA